MKIFTSEKQKVGLIGENIAKRFLMKHNFTIIEQNFGTRFGEIDIVSERLGRIYFFEVKTINVSHETQSFHVPRETNNLNVPHETNLSQRREQFIKENRIISNPFQNISRSKIQKFIKTVQIYLKVKNVSRETPWQMDGIAIFLDLENKKATIKHLSNIGIL